MVEGPVCVMEVDAKEGPARSQERTQLPRHMEGGMKKVLHAAIRCGIGRKEF